MGGNSMQLKVVALIEYINLTTDVIDQEANSSSIIVLEGKTIANDFVRCTHLVNRSQIH